MQSNPSSQPRLLLIETDQMVRETIALMLQDNYDVAVAENGGAALPLLTPGAAPLVDMVLLDCLLPRETVSDILEVADRLRVPVVLLGGDPTQAQGLDPKRPFLAKPFTQRVLLAILDSARG